MTNEPRTAAHVSYHLPQYPLLGAPRRHWDAERGHYIRKKCSYHLNGAYVWSEEPHTGRHFCATCIAKHGFVVGPNPEDDQVALDVARIDELRTR